MNKKEHDELQKYTMDIINIFDQVLDLKFSAKEATQKINSKFVKLQQKLTSHNNHFTKIYSDSVCDYCANRPKECNFCDNDYYSKFRGRKLREI